MRTFQLGNEVRFDTTFAHNGQAANPTDVTLTLRDPNGVEIEPSIINPGTGRFFATFTPQIAGVWHYRWQGTGSLWAAKEDSFEIASSDFGG